MRTDHSRRSTIYQHMPYNVPTLQMKGLLESSINHKCLVPIYVFPEMKLLFSKQNYNVLSPSFYTHISVRDLYISGIGLPILLQGNTQSTQSCNRCFLAYIQ